jgi:hypothetical protein
MVTGVTFPLESLPAAVTARAETWATLGISWRVHPVEPNHGNAVIIGEFESAAWLGDILIWITGEAELETIRLADGRSINKHYDLTHTPGSGGSRSGPCRCPPTPGLTARFCTALGAPLRSASEGAVLEPSSAILGPWNMSAGCPPRRSTGISTTSTA